MTTRTLPMVMMQCALGGSYTISCQLLTFASTGHFAVIDGEEGIPPPPLHVYKLSILELSGKWIAVDEFSRLVERFLS